MTGLVRSFSRRRNLSSGSIHCCHMITGTEFKRKYILEQDELLCCAVISSGLKEKRFVLSSSLRIPDPYLLLESPRPFSSLGTPDFLSNYLGLVSLWKRERYNSVISLHVHSLLLSLFFSIYSEQLFYWSLVDCVSFKCMAKSFIYIHTYIYSFSGSFPF